MKHADIKAMMAEIAPVIREFTEAALSPVLDRIGALEKQIADAPVPQDGKDADEGAIEARIQDKMAEELASIREAIPTIELPDIGAMVAEAVEALPKPQDGKSVTAEDIAPLVAEEVERAVSALPAPKDGQDGRDGAGLAGAMIDRGGNLVLTLTDGSVKELGTVVGKDGDKGMDGQDGVGFDDLDIIFDGERSFTMLFAKGERVKEFPFRLPVVLDRGVYKADDTYHAGDGVTWGGSFWIAQEATAEKPDSGKGWRLAVKRGRDGKDGVLKAEKPKEPIKVG